ncbi:HNH endonuclease signature motif containing protein [Corynebacterium sp. CNCTC7651]|uniref:HNH endonuclease signature motif containing protein n=1 Tax=Corynebacterium sp. CNCTC7651 TaxID=2815361 RepID=UPI001F263B3C|nr:HNH endonuclease signature motif containing protein [Corynebacterium sp. CNCTC7651]
MNLMSFLEATAGDPLSTLAGFDMDTAVALGIEPTRARLLDDVHSAYLAPSNAHKQQARAVGLVQQAGLSLHHLMYLENHLKRVPARERGAKRLVALTEAAAKPPKNYNAFTRTVKAAVPLEQKPPQDTASFGRNRMGKTPVNMWMDEHDAADLQHAARHNIDTTKPAGPQMLQNLLRIFRANVGATAGAGDPARAGDAPGASHPAGFDAVAGANATASAAGTMPVPFSVPRPIINVQLPDWVSILEGRGDEVILGLTDGTTMTGAEFLQRFVATKANHLEAALFKPGEGAVNLYRMDRFANAKQRDLASMVNPVCPWPDCTSPAVHNQAHHVTPWKHGGQTNLNNLVMVCRYHNHVNDDDVGRRKRGRIEIRNGEGVWVSPRGFPVPNPYHPYGAMRPT